MGYEILHIIIEYSQLGKITNIELVTIMFK